MNLLFILALRGAEAAPPELFRATPDDVVAAYFVGGPPRDQAGDSDKRPQSSFEFATFLIDQAFAVGLLSGLSDCTRAWLDALASLSVVFEHPHAAMLFDVRAEKADADSHRLADLHAALVLHTAGRNQRIEGRIQHLLGSYANREESMLEKQERDGRTVFHLRDRRLPEWTVFSWGSIGDGFVVAIGDGSFERVEASLKDRSASVADDAWFREGLNRLAAEDALLAVYLQFDELKKKSGPALAGKVLRVQQALEIPGCERGLWAVGYAGRSVEIRQLLRIDSTDRSAALAGAESLDAAEAAIIPDPASAFAALDIQPSQWFDRARNAYLAARSPSNQAKSRAYWGNFEGRAGISFADDIFASLSGPIVVHDYPPHALRLPPAWTIVTPLKGDPLRLRRAIDSLFTAWQRDLEESGAVRLHRDDDGLWHLQAGIEGPALMLTDQHLVISFSPLAVHQNVELLSKLPHWKGNQE